MGVTFIAKEGTYTAPATLTTKTITENGTYSAVDDSANGYSSVVVNVEGGGGSSDLSTANVVLKNSNSGRYFQVKPYKVIYIDGNDNLVVNNDYDQVSTEKTYSLVMYKGATFVPLTSLQYFDMYTPPVITGSAEVIMSPVAGINITGDCTITIKGTGGGAQ